MDRIKRLLNKDISEWVKKNKIGITSVVVLMLIGIIGMYVTYAYYQVIDETKVINATVTEIPDLEVRIMAEQRDSNGNGLNSYGEYPYIPQAGYQYNSSNSYCVHGSTINYRSATYDVEITSEGGDLCYLYFDSTAQLDITINVMAENVDNDGVGVGTYTKLETTALPSVGYTLSSYTCDNGSTISYSDSENLFTVNSSGKDECTIYMDAVNPDISLKMFVQASENSSTYNEVSKLKGCYTMRKNEADHNSSCTGTSSISYENGKVVIGATSKTDCVAYLDLSDECSALELGRTLNTTQGANGLYYHNEKLTNGANDKSYRYYGANPNNYICFGSDAQTCPDGNLYRIIGMIPVDVVIDSTTTPVTTERQTLFKLIRNDYETETTLGMIAATSSVSKVNPYEGPTGNQPSDNVQGFYWSGSSSNQYNTWSLSTLNTIGLNTNAYGEFGNTWQEIISNVIWKVGGNTWSNIGEANPMNTLYQNEILNPVTTNSQDGKKEYAANIGMMYVSDYGYAVPVVNWVRQLVYNSGNGYSNLSVIGNNWLYKGVNEWTITRSADDSNKTINVASIGIMNYVSTSPMYGVRRTFYLNKNIKIDPSLHTGSKTDPYRINIGA